VEAAEAVVVTVLIIGVVLFLLMSLPRRREVARGVGCRQNLMKLGIAVSLCDQTTEKLPGVDSDGGKPTGPSPIARMLDVLGQPDFADFESRDKAPPRHKEKLVRLRIPGLICPTDPRAASNTFDAPVSYRATTGDTPDGRNGAFAPGWVGSLKDVEAGDGTGYTAGFSERLLGSGTDGGVSPENYALVPGPLTAARPSVPAPKSWQGNAGSDWRSADWISTLYNHALVPGSPDSRVADGGRSALMGASSGHEEGVFVLFLDGSVKTVTRTVDPAVWRGQATRDDGR
jgi:hypothetical protein